LQSQISVTEALPVWSTALCINGVLPGTASNYGVLEQMSTANAPCLKNKVLVAERPYQLLWQQLACMLPSALGQTCNWRLLIFFANDFLRRIWRKTNILDVLP